MTRATKIENGVYKITITGKDWLPAKAQTYRITKGGNLNPGWHIWLGKEHQYRAKSKFNAEVFLNYGNPALLSSNVKHYRY